MAINLKVFSRFLLCVFFIFCPISVFAADYGVDLLAEKVGFKIVKTDNFSKDVVLDTIGKFISIFLGLLGVVFLVLIIYYGVQWMLVGGDEQKVKNIKSGLVSLVFGFVLILMAYTITSFVFSFFN